jgi:hypothetical protein
MKRIALGFAGLLLAVAPLGVARAEPGFCGPSEGCDPCPFTVTIDKSGPHIQWYYC